MALERFNPDLMKFMHLLVRHNRMLALREAGRQFGSVSERTARRWLAFLKKQCFDYYPYADCESLGLKHFEVLLSSVKDEKIYGIIPHAIHIIKGNNLSRGGKACASVSFWIPPHAEKNFRKFWHLAEKAGLAKAHIYKFGPAVEYYAPFHEIVNEDGTLKLNSEHDFSFFSKMLGEKKQRQKISPICIPIIFEMMRENWNATLIWMNAKKKLNKKVNDYFKNNHRNGSDQSRILQISKSLSFLQDNFGKIFRQVRIAYGPFVSADKIMCLAHFNYSGDIAALAELAANKSLLLNVRTFGTQHSFYFITSAEGFNAITKELALSCTGLQLILRDAATINFYSKTRRLMKFPYWDVFEPQAGEWKFEYEKYARELEGLKG